MTPLNRFPSAQIIIDRITQETGHPAHYAKNFQPNLADKTMALPSFFVGYSEIMSLDQVETGWTPDTYGQLAQDLIITYRVMYVCRPEDFDKVWNELNLALAGFNPSKREENTASLTVRGGDPLGLQNGRFWWADEYALAFPALNPEIVQ